MTDVESSVNVCTDGFEICHADDIEPEGPVECSFRSQSAGRDYCDTSVECAATATVDGTTLQLFGVIYAYCYQESETNWLCQCEGGSEYADFELTGSDAWNVCTEASEVCPDLIDTSNLFNDENGGYIDSDIDMDMDWDSDTDYILR